MQENASIYQLQITPHLFSSSEYHLFLKLKRSLVGRKCSCNEGIKEAVKRKCANQEETFFLRFRDTTESL